MSALVPYYRNYELPWTPTEEVEQRFRRVVRNCLIGFLALVVVMALLPLPEQSQQKSPALPDRVVQLVLEKRTPPPPPKVVEPEQPVEEPKPVEKPEIKPEPKPQPDRAEQARKQAAKALAVFDELNDLRDSAAVNKVQQSRTLTNAVAAARSERSMITSSVGKGSGGINNAALSRGYGGSTGELAGHDTTQVTSALATQADRSAVQRAADVKGKKGRRDGSEVAQILDSNKGAIFAMYTRALREKPDLQGKVVLKLVIAPTGEVTNCEIVSSELNDAELERKLVARIRSIRFPAQDVEPLTVTHPIEFFPAG